MRRGPWHQFGDRSQKLVLGQLQQGVGVGVILSPRDLSFENAIDYGQQYRALGAQVLVDQQFYFPGFINEKISSYPISQFRTSVSELNQISDADLTALAAALRLINSELHTSAILAPAVIYEAGRPEIVRLNHRLFLAAKQVAGDLGLPTYATILLGRSVTAADQTVNEILARATAIESDGWYFGFEFDGDRIPSSRDAVRRCCVAGLTLACTGKPVLHAYAGPIALLSFGFGATGAGIGHSQNLWQFTRERWEEPAIQGGGGDAPPRFFSSVLWGTVVYPDEALQLPTSLRNEILTHSPFSDAVRSGLAWNRWDANKHFVFAVSSTLSDMAATLDARACAAAARARLTHAVELHVDIATSGVTLRDATNTYQGSWILAIEDLIAGHSSDFEYLSLLV